MKAFISYSHKDSEYLDRLHTHLATLKREGKITAWYDREILPGDKLHTEIESQLCKSKLFLALVSPDFIASKYCYEKEVQTALKMHEEKKCRVIPIIVEPCDWQSTPLKALKAVPRDGKPISEWANKNTAFLDVITELRRIIKVSDKVKATTSVPDHVKMAKNARRYRAKRDFDEIERGRSTDGRNDGRALKAEPHVACIEPRFIALHR